MNTSPVICASETTPEPSVPSQIEDNGGESSSRFPLSKEVSGLLDETVSTAPALPTSQPINETIPTLGVFALAADGRHPLQDIFDSPVATALDMIEKLETLEAQAEALLLTNISRYVETKRGFSLIKSLAAGAETPARGKLFAHLQSIDAEKIAKAKLRALKRNGPKVMRPSGNLFNGA